MYIIDSERRVGYVDRGGTGLSMKACLRVVARKTGVSIDAIRFYEKAGLLSAPARSSGRYRLYDARALEDLAFIQKAQRPGVLIGGGPTVVCDSTASGRSLRNVRDLVAQKLATVRKKIEELRSLEVGLSAALSRCQRTSDESDDIAKHVRC